MQRRVWVFAAVCVIAGAVAAMPAGCEQVKSERAASASLPQNESPDGFARRSSFDVRAYGAAGDGKTLDTNAINAAIAAAADAGGGTVRFSAGTYLSYSIHLKSNIGLYLDHGATLLAAPSAKETPGAAYDAAEPFPGTTYQDFGHSHFHNSLIWGENLHDVSITGPGMIDGSGLARAANDNNPVGNKSLALKLCRNVTIRDVTFYRAGHFAILATGVDNFTVDNVKFDTNRDGIDIDCCKNVRVSNCLVNSPTDDGICLKSSYALGEARVTENVTITNCQVSGYAMGSLLDGRYDRDSGGVPANDPIGRIKFGTESNGGFKNITISNCVFDHCRGLAIESVDGGVIEDVTVSNLAMRDICESPLFIRLGNRARGPEGSPVAQIRRINISNIIASGVDSRFPCDISGIPGHAIEDVRISNVRIAYRGGGTAQDAARAIPEKEKGYPEPTMFGVLPASAFFIRHVKGLEMHHIDATFEKDDARPVFVLDDVTNAGFQYIQAPHMQGIPIFSLKNVNGFSTHQVKGVMDTKRDAVTEESIIK